MKLYHYCSNQAFISIIRNKQVWFSDLSMSNDLMEGRWLHEVVKTYCEEMHLSSGHIEQLLSRLDVCLRVCGAAGLCLSEDGDLLSQWRAYADNGGGVAIGFESEYFKKLGARNRSDSYDFNVALVQIEYDREKQRQSIVEPMKKILSLVEQGALDSLTLIEAAHEGAQERRYHDRRRLDLQFLYFMFELFTLKNPAFAEEKEWRAISHVIEGSGKQSDLLSYRSGEDRIVPYIPVNLDPLEILPVSEVVLGPRNITPTNIVEKLMETSGFEGAIVKRSTATYR